MELGNKRAEYNFKINHSNYENGLNVDFLWEEIYADKPGLVRENCVSKSHLPPTLKHPIYREINKNLTLLISGCASAIG